MSGRVRRAALALTLAAVLAASACGRYGKPRRTRPAQPPPSTQPTQVDPMVPAEAPAEDEEKQQ